jgi:coatomer subunit beta'
VKKLFNLHKLGDDKIMMEVNPLMRVKHQNVVQFVGYCAETRYEAMVPQGSSEYIWTEIPERLLCFEHVCNKSLDKYISGMIKKNSTLFILFSLLFLKLLYENTS